MVSNFFRDPREHLLKLLSRLMDGVWGIYRNKFLYIHFPREISQWRRSQSNSNPWTPGSELLAEQLNADLLTSDFPPWPEVFRGYFKERNINTTETRVGGWGAFIFLRNKFFQGDVFFFLIPIKIRNFLLFKEWSLSCRWSFWLLVERVGCGRECCLIVPSWSKEKTVNVTPSRCCFLESRT